MVYLVTGRINSGKTTKMMQLYDEFQGDGFVAAKAMDRSSVVKFEAVRLSTKESILLAMSKPYFHGEFPIACEIGPYVFNLHAIEKIENDIQIMIKNHVNPLFLDEVGLLEITDRCFAPIILKMLQSRLDCYFSLREDLMMSFVDHFKIGEYQVI